MNTTLKKFILSLVMMLSVVTADCQKLSKPLTPSLNPDSIPGLSTSQIQLINLNFNSMIYWYNTANKLDTLFRLERQKVQIYGKITRIQVKNISELEQLYLNKQAVDKAIAEEKRLELEKLKSENRKLKFKTTILSIGVGVTTSAALYLAIFR